MDLLGQLIALVEGGVGFGVGVGAGLEIAVGLFLHGDDISLDTDATEQLAHRLVAGAAKRGVEHMQAGGLHTRKVQPFDHNTVIVGGPQGLGNVFDEAFGLECVEGLLGQNEIGGLLDLVVHDRSGLVGHLAAILTVALDAVVHARIVRGGNHDAAAAVQLTHSVRKHGGGRKLVVDVHLDAGLGQCGRADLGIEPGVVAAVIPDGAGLGQIGAV